jgi:hypothetical protein
MQAPQSNLQARLRWLEDECISTVFYRFLPHQLRTTLRALGPVARIPQEKLHETRHTILRT